MNKYLSRVTSSARGELFNPLMWPFLFTTLVFGVGALFTNSYGSSLIAALLTLNPAIHIIWGIVAILTIICGATFLLFNIPPFGKVSGLVGFMLWIFASWAYYFSGAWVPLLAVAVPNMWFWIWQYLSLSLFRRQDAEDTQTLEAYNRGRYDDEENPKAAGRARRNNRGVDPQ